MFESRSLLFFPLYLRNLTCWFGTGEYLHIERKEQGVSSGLKHGFGGDRSQDLLNESIMLCHR